MEMEVDSDCSDSDGHGNDNKQEAIAIPISKRNDPTPAGEIQRVSGGSVEFHRDIEVFRSFREIPWSSRGFQGISISLNELICPYVAWWWKDHCQLTYKPGSQDAITTKNERIYNLLYLYVLRLKIRLDRTLFLLIRCLVVSKPKFSNSSINVATKYSKNSSKACSKKSSNGDVEYYIE